MRKILSYLKPHCAYMAMLMSVKVLGTLAELALPYILSHIIDGVIGRLGADADVTSAEKSILLWAGVMVLCAVAAVCLNVSANRMAAKVAKTVAGEIRGDLFRRTVRLSPAQTDRYTVASLESRITTDTYNIHHFLNVIQRMGVRAPILLVGGLAVTATLDPVLTLVMAAALPLIFISVYGISVKGLPLFRRAQMAVDRMVKVVREDAQGIRVIKALSRTEYENGRYEEVNRSLADEERRANETMAAANPLMNLFMNLGLTAVVMAGALRVNAGLTDPGRIVAFIQYFTLISTAMMSVSRLFVIYSKASASAGRVAEVLETPEELTVVKTEDAAAPECGEDYIVFDHVCFSYAGGGEVIKDVSFTLQRGQTLGIIGATGSGKTTLLALLMRLYDVSSGSVRIGGRDVRTIPEDELHSMFGAAMQNDFIYTGTVGDNISFMRGIPEDDVRAAAVTAQADGFIRDFPEGYSHMLTSKGTNVSGGQRQRVLVARAAAGRPDILVLDDSSSALDYRTDSALRRAIAKDMAGTTAVIVAQRVSSVRRCDKILVLSEGGIIGSGTDGELMQSCALYREIAESQMGGAILD